MKKKRLKRFILVLFCLAIVGGIAVLAVNGYVKAVGGKHILSSDEAAELSDFDCILVLGCQVKDNGKPSDMLKDRLTRGIEVYNLGAAPKMLMSGDHGREEYDEVGTMKQYAVWGNVDRDVCFVPIETYNLRDNEDHKAEVMVLIKNKLADIRRLISEMEELIT